MEKYIYFFLAVGIFGILFVIPAQLAFATRALTRRKKDKLYCFIPVVNEYYSDIVYMGRPSIMSISKTILVIAFSITAILFFNAATSTAFIISKWVLLIALIFSYFGKAYTTYRYLSDMNVWTKGTCILYGIVYIVGVSSVKATALLFNGGKNDSGK